MPMQVRLSISRNVPARKIRDLLHEAEIVEGSLPLMTPCQVQRLRPVLADLLRPRGVVRAEPEMACAVDGAL